MKKCALLYLPIFILSFFACSQKKEEAKEAELLAVHEGDAIQLVQQNIAKAFELDSLRKVEGTINVLDYAVLQKCFPKEIIGYVAQEPLGEMVDFAGEKYSDASVRFTRNGQNEYLDIRIMDLLNSVNVYASSIGLWLIGEADEELEKNFQIFEIPSNKSICYKRFDKLAKEAVLYCGLGYRFLIEILATNQINTDLVQEVYGLLEFDKLGIKGD